MSEQHQNRRKPELFDSCVLHDSGCKNAARFRSLVTQFRFYDRFVVSLGLALAGLLLTNVLICCAMVHRIKKVEATLPVEYLQRVGYLQVRHEGKAQQ